jgi:hypothetical protein
MEPVRYMPIPTFPGYMAGSDGSILSLKFNGGLRKKPKVLTQTIGSTGYPMVCPKSGLDGKCKYMPAHRLIAWAFHGYNDYAITGDYVRHLNDIKTDNRPENLAYGKPIDNSMDSIANGGKGSYRSNGRVLYRQWDDITREWYIACWNLGVCVKNLKVAFGFCSISTCSTTSQALGLKPRKALKKR